MATFLEVLRERVDRIRAAVDAESRGESPEGFIPTGLTALDKRGGLKRGVLTIFGADTGCGKSILSLHLATAAAMAGMEVLYFSFEDPAELAADRSLATATGINSEQISAYKVADEIERLEIALTESDTWAHRIEMIDELMSSGQVLAAMRGHFAPLVIVDYLQSLREEPSGIERTIAGFCWDANKWAQQHNSAVVALSQIKASVEERGLRLQEAHARRHPDRPAYIDGFRPFGPSDLAWCTAAGQRCRELGFLFRPARYRRRFGEAVKDDVLEISYPKRNFGAEGTVRARIDVKTSRLSDLKE